LFKDDDRGKLDEEELFFKLSHNNQYEVDNPVTRLNKRGFVKLNEDDLI